MSRTAVARLLRNDIASRLGDLVTDQAVQVITSSSSAWVPASVRVQPRDTAVTIKVAVPAVSWQEAERRIQTTYHVIGAESRGKVEFMACVLPPWLKLPSGDTFTLRMSRESSSR